MSPDKITIRLDWGYKFVLKTNCSDVSWWILSEMHISQLQYGEFTKIIEFECMCAY